MANSRPFLRSDAVRNMALFEMLIRHGISSNKTVIALHTLIPYCLMVVKME